ncbi:hypothetical protein [Microcystis aeruginosa]|uniref:hypothetical protein n=1 Tax=Microcystis aeruginosa TaxID=1126 RepID=UPI001EFC297B|nr:hypothetical protein [Microcystis aeruginosa]
MASLLLCLVVSGLPSSIILSSNGGDNLAIFKETGDRRQETGDRRLFLFTLPTPYTPHPTSPTLHLPNTPHPTSPLPHFPTTPLPTTPTPSPSPAQLT